MARDNAYGRTAGGGNHLKLGFAQQTGLGRHFVVKGSTVGSLQNAWVYAEKASVRRSK